MTELLVSSIWRGVRWENSGVLWHVNLNNNSVKEVFYLNRDPKIGKPRIPKGGHRSARGMCFWKGCYWVSGYDFIAKISLNPFTVKEVYSDKTCLDIHSIYDGGDSILITSTYNNSVFKFDGQRFKKILDLTDTFINTNTLPDSLHLNTLLGDYAVLCTYDQVKSAIVDTNKKQIIFTHDDYIFAHDLQIINTGEFVTNSSGTSKLFAVCKDGSNSRVLFDYNKYKKGEDSKLSKWGWLRGLCYDKISDKLYVGVPPSTVLIFSNVSNNIELTYELELYKYINNDINIDLSVFDIMLLR